MRTNKRQMSLSDIKDTFHQTGFVDWHITPRLSSETHEDGGSADTIVVASRPELKRPPMYVVVLMNDDYTPMDFVIEILQQYFAMNLDQATQVMLTVHYEGKGVAGVYPRDIAETKANQVNNYARSQSHPLLCQIEPKD